MLKLFSLFLIFAFCLGISWMNAQEAQPAPQVPSHVPTNIVAKWQSLSVKDQEALYHLVKAATVMDQIFFRQVYSHNPEMLKALREYQGADKAMLEAKFLIHFGPFDRLEGDKAFFGNAKKPLGAAFYPEDMTAEEFQNFVKEHPECKEAFESPYTIIARDAEGKLKTIAYPEYYKALLHKAIVHLEKAAQLVENPSLKKYLQSRVADLQSNDYFQSDCDWLDLKDHPIELVIGPYEVYEDSLFNYKAAYESFVYIPDAEETHKVQAFISYLKEMQASLPVDKKYLAENIASLSPLQVVDLMFSAGDAKAGVHTIAFALPNDEKVRELKGSKKVILQNVMEAKYRSILLPIAQIVIVPEQIQDIHFKAFLYHVILHELSHTLGADYIDPQADRISVRKSLKESYSIIEEAKADAAGLYNALLMIDKKVIPEELKRAVFVTQLASMFRSMRFGVEEAHGGANLIQINFLKEKGGIVEKDGKFAIDFEKIIPALKLLVQEILEIEGTGDYERAKQFIAKYGQLDDNLKQKLQMLQTIPVDIQPVFQSVRDIGNHFDDHELNRDRYLD